MAKVHGESKLTFLESTSIIIGHGVGSGILSVPFLASRNNWHDIIWIAAVAYCMNLLLHFMIAELSLNNNGAQFIKCFENELFVGKLKMACTWLAFGLLGFSVVVNVSGFITGAAAVFSAWFHLPSVAGMLIFYVLAASVVYIGMKLVGICEKIAVISMFGVIGILFVATMLSEITELSAAFYFNEEAVGKAVRESGIPREDFFLTSKVWKDHLGYDSTLQEFESTCKRLGTDYLDLYLIHWPRPSDLNAEWRDLDVETWKALEDLYKSKKVRAIGVSNFLPHHLNNLLERTSITPMVNQLEFHPGYMQKAAVDFCKQMGIQVEAWSPIGRARVLKEPLLMELAEKYQVSVAQICIRFALQCGVLPLPKSSSSERMHQNLDVFGFDIEENDMYQLMTLPQIGWSGEHPDRERVRF